MLNVATIPIQDDKSELVKRSELFFKFFRGLNKSGMKNDSDQKTSHDMQSYGGILGITIWFYFVLNF